MSTTPRNGKPYVWVTWLTALLAGDAECVWSSWFKAHFKYDKVARTFDTAAWSADHSALVKVRVDELKAAGWHVTVENQNAFKLVGHTATLAGKPDILAVRDTDVLVVDAKTGKQRNSDWWQVLVYLVAAPNVWPELKGRTMRGEVLYRDHRVTVEPEEVSADRRARIFDLLRTLGGDVRPERVPSPTECEFCDISASDCPQRHDAPVAEAQMAEF